MTRRTKDGLMTTAQAAAFQKRWNEIKARIAKDRDDLRELKEEMDAIEDSCERALDALEEAGDILSEYV